MLFITFYIFPTAYNYFATGYFFLVQLFLSLISMHFSLRKIFRDLSIFQSTIFGNGEENFDAWCLDLSHRGLRKIPNFMRPRVPG